MAACLRNGWPDLDAAGLRDREREHGVEEVARHRERDDGQADRDQNRAAQHVERLAVQGVRLEVEHGQPDPHRGKDLHQREPPVGHEQPEAGEQHHERADHERERGEHAARAAQPEHRLLDLRLVVLLDRPHERADAARERGRPPISRRARQKAPERRGRPSCSWVANVPRARSRLLSAGDDGGCDHQRERDQHTERT